MKSKSMNRFRTPVPLRLLFVLVVFAGASALAQPVGCPAGMTHYWQFEESGSPYDDYYGGSDATCTICPDLIPGIVGNAQQFNRIDDQIIVVDYDTFEWGPTSDYSIEFWMKSSGCGCIQSGYDCNEVIVSRFGVSNAWWIGITCENDLPAPPGRLRCYFGGTDIFSSVSVADDQWHHIVFMRDHAADQCRLYIDGVPDGSVSGGGADRSGTAPLQIGWANSAPFYRYGGTLDELALYSIALTVPEILSHWSGGSGQNYCNVQQSPLIVSTPVTAATVGEQYTYDVNANGIPTPTYTLLVAPTGMSIDDITGVITWIPASIGPFNVQVEATNSLGSDIQAFTVAVDPVRICAPNLTHYWKLDEPSGPTFVDSQGGLDAHCANCPTPIAGHIGGAVDLDRSDDGMNVVDHPSLDWGVNDSYTIEFWMNKTTGCVDATQPSNEVIVGRSGAGWWIGMNCEAPLASQKIRAYIAGTQLFSSTSVNDGIWHHIVFMRDAVAGSYSLYVDSVLEATTVAAGHNMAGSDSLTFGYFNGPAPGKYRFGGIIDEVAFYNAPLPEQLIRSHYNHGFGGRYCYLCGDADANGIVNISDAVYLITFIFGGGAPPAPLLAGDADCNGFITISDAVYLISFIFAGGPAPCANCP